MNRKIKQGIALLLSTLLLCVLCVALLAAALRQDTVETEEVAESEERTGKSYRVLVLGRDDAASLCDVMMLCYFDAERGAAAAVQIPRDTYCRVRESGYSKINGAATAAGGAEALCALMSEALGVSIPYYVSLDTDAFGRIVDAVGGVTVTLPYELRYEDPAAGLSIRLPAGEQILDGDGAEQLVRYRSGYVRGDLGRIDAQKLFLASLLERLQQDISLGSLVRLVGALLPRVQTNLPLTDMLRLTKQVRALPLSQVSLLTLPGEDVRSERSGAWYYVISREGSRAVVNTYLGGEVAYEGFDAARRFCYDRDAAFCRIYDGMAEAISYDAAAVRENGIQIPTIK